VQLTEADQELYKNFPLTVSERWQQEIAETIFDAVNQEADKLELKKRQKQSEESEENCKFLRFAIPSQIQTIAVNDQGDCLCVSQSVCLSRPSLC